MQTVQIVEIGRAINMIRGISVCMIGVQIYYTVYDRRTRVQEYMLLCIMVRYTAEYQQTQQLSLVDTILYYVVHNMVHNMVHNTMQPCMLQHLHQHQHQQKQHLLVTKQHGTTTEAQLILYVLYINKGSCITPQSSISLAYLYNCIAASVRGFICRQV